jgi:hypothetical protein
MARSVTEVITGAIGPQETVPTILKTLGTPSSPSDSKFTIMFIVCGFGCFWRFSGWCMVAGGPIGYHRLLSVTIGDRLVTEGAVGYRR